MNPTLRRTIQAGQDIPTSDGQNQEGGQPQQRLRASLKYMMKTMVEENVQVIIEDECFKNETRAGIVKDMI